MTLPLPIMEQTASEEGSGLSILQIIPSLKSGGAERSVIDMAQALIKRGHRSLVISSGGSLVRELEQENVLHFTWPVEKKNPMALFRNALSLSEFIARQKIDIVHAHSRAPAWSAYLATRWQSVPFVTTFHAAYKGQTSAKLFYNSVMARADSVIAISEFIASHIQAQYPVALGRVITIPNGIDLSLFKPASVTETRIQAFRDTLGSQATVPLLVMPGRLSSIKGHELVLKALAPLSDLPFCCVLIGSDQGRTAYRQKLNDLIVELSLKERVVFSEYKDLPAVYRAASVILCPSQVPEGFGRVPVEAQAMERPVIATDLGATKETVLHEKTGWLVPLADVETLSRTIRRALALSVAERQKMGQLGRSHVERNFSLDVMAEATISLYERLAKKKKIIT